MGNHEARPRRRVVVTGLGAITPLGLNVTDHWDGLVNGRSGITRISQWDPTGYPTQIAGEVKGFDPLNFIEKKEIKKMGRFIQFAIAASEFAYQASGFKVSNTEEAERTGRAGRGLVLVKPPICGVDSDASDSSAIGAGGPLDCRHCARARPPSPRQKRSSA